jgi:4-amino-4-deoxy-L-arabinose transferase-like glycosyltransferase
VVTSLVGVASIFISYRLAADLFENRAVGLISALLLSVNPAHLWLSSTPLTELLNATLLSAAVWAGVRYLKNGQRGALWAAAVSLAAANGFRFEAWLISALFTLALLLQAAGLLRQKKLSGRMALALAGAGALPWLFPLAWVIGNYLATHDPLYFLNAIKDYKLQWYGGGVFYARYVTTFWGLDPYLTALGLVGLAAALLRGRRRLARLWYGAAAVIPLAIYIASHGGQSEPPGNYVRYLGQFTFIFYPALADLLVWLAQALKPARLRVGLLTVLLVVMTVTQVRAALRFTNDPAAAGLAVGLAIRRLRAQDPTLAGRPVLIELAYWQYLAIHTGANDIDQIMYDRVLDTTTRQTTSLLLTDLPAFRACLQTYRIGYVIVQAAELRAIIETQLQLQPTQVVNGYAFYPVSAGLLDEPAAAVCPLPLDAQR